MPPRLRKATLHGALFKLVKTRLCREWVRNLFGRSSGKLPRSYTWGRRIQPSSLALSLATPHARSRNSTGVIGASSSSPMLCEVLIPGPSASLRNVTSYFVPGKLITISPSCISSFRRGSFIGVSVGGHCGKPLPLST
jgi:hypothetical protein